MPIYLNPYFLTAILLFWVNQFVEKVLNLYLPWVHAYLDDLLAMPVVLGITLQIYRWIHPKKEKFVFTNWQIFIGFAYFSFLFEILIPKWSTNFTADFRDVICYGLGAIIFTFKINIPVASPQNHDK
jgi:hypothetical protein